MLEPAMHDIFGEGGAWELLTLQEHDAIKNVHWTTPTNPLVSAYLHLDSNGIVINGVQTQTCAGSPLTLELPAKGVPLTAFAYYRPSSLNQATYDAVIYDPQQNRAIIFQSSSGLTHTVKESGIEDLFTRGVQFITYVAVTPPNTSIKYLAPKTVSSRIDAKYQLILI
jgi:hypothetical protein